MRSTTVLNKVPIVPSLICSLIIGLFLGFCNLGNADINDNNGWCLVKKADNLQIAFVLDRTKSYEEHGIKLAKNILPKVIDILKSQYKEVTYALTTFADYTDAQGLVIVPRTDPQSSKVVKGRDDLDEMDERTNETGCYEFKMDFNSNPDPVLEAISTIKYIKPGGSGESSFTAILFSAADKKLSWTETPKVVDVLPTSSTTFKAVVLLTEETSTQSLTTDKVRTPVKGDGTDSCEETKLPTPADIKKVLGMNNIHVAAVVNEVGTRNKIWETWVGHFQSFDITNPKTKVYLWGNGTDTDMDDKDANGIVSAITSSLGDECEMADPPGNNMLGL